MHQLSRLRAGLGALVLLAAFLAAGCGEAEDGDGGQTPAETGTTESGGVDY